MVLITFGTANSSDTNTDLSTSPSQAAISAFWDDLYVTGATDSKVVYQVLGSGSSTHLVVQWNDISFYSDSSRLGGLTFEAVLGIDGSIRFNYQSLSTGRNSGVHDLGVSATAGVKDAGSNRLVLMYNNGPTTLVNSAKSVILAPGGSTGDYYSFTVAATETDSLVLSNVTSGSLSLDLYSSDGTLLASGVGSATNLAKVINNYGFSTPGTYYARVTGDASVSYSLVATHGAAFDTESNDAFATAQDITGTGGVLGYLSGTSDAGDYYRLSVNAGNLLSLDTLTPGDGLNLFVNVLDPKIELYNPSGTLVASNDNGAPDRHNAVLNYTATTAGNYVVRVLAAANGGEYFLSTQITVGNNPPTSADAAVTTVEDTDKAFAVGDFPFTDVDTGDQLQRVQVTGLPTAGTLYLDANLNGTVDGGEAVTINQEALRADLTAGKLKFKPVADGNGSPYTTFQFKVQDGQAYSALAYTITVNVTSVNDAPAGTDKAVTMLEDGTYTVAAADFGFSDPLDSPANNFLAVKIATLPAAGSLKLNGAAVTAGQVVTVTNVAANKLTFAPPANAKGTGYASFTFQVQDDGGTANGGADLDPTPNTITVNVTSVNDAPAGTDKAVTMLEDGTYTVAAADFGFSDPLDSPANNFLAVKIATLPAAGSLKLNGAAVTAGQVVTVTDVAANKLTFAPPANAKGTGYASFTFQVQDDGGTANGGADLDPTPNTITVNVTSVNDAPAGTDKAVTMLEDGTYTVAAADFGFSDPLDSPANNFLAVKIATLPAAGSLKLQRRGGDGGPVGDGDRRCGRQADLRSAGQRQGDRLRQLHVPGAGRRRDGQRRRGPGPHAQHDHGERDKRERRAGGNGQGGDDARERDVHGGGGGLRVQRSAGQSGQQLPGGEDRDASGGRER